MNPKLNRIYAILPLLFLSVGAPAAGIQDNFSDGNDDGWTRYEPLAPSGAPGVFSFPSGGYRIQANSSPDPISLGPGRAGSFRTDQVYTTDFFTSADLVAWDNSLDQSFGLMGRVNSLGAGTFGGYALTYSTAGLLSLSRFSNDMPTLLKSAAVTLDPGRHYLLDIEGNGTLLIGAVYAETNHNNPITFVTAHDATFPSGMSGFYLFGNSGPASADATFDNYIAGQNVPEPSTVFLAGAVFAALGAFRARRWVSRQRSKR